MFFNHTQTDMFKDLIKDYNKTNDNHCLIKMKEMIEYQISQIKYVDEKKPYIK